MDIINTNTSKRAVLALRILSAVLFLTAVTNPLLAYIIQSYSDLPVETVTSILTMPALVGIFVSFLIGPIALKINKKYLLLFSVSTTLIYFGIFAFVGSGGPFIMLIIGACILGISRGSGMALVNSSIAEFVEEKKRATTIASCMAIMQGGSAMVAIIGGRIAAVNDGANWPYAHFLGALTIPAVILFAILMPKRAEALEKSEEQAMSEKAAVLQKTVIPEKQTILVGQNRVNKSDKTNEYNEISKQENEVTDDVTDDAADNVPGDVTKETAATVVAYNFLKNKNNLKVVAIIFLNFLLSVSFAAFFLNSSIYIILEHELGTSATAGLVSSSFTITGVIVGFSYRIWGKLLKDWIVPFGYSLFVIGFISMLTITTHIIGIWMAAALFSIGFNLTNPYIASSVMSLTSKKYVPITMAFFASSGSLGIFLAPFILRFTGEFLGGGLVGSIQTALVIMPFCVLASFYLFKYKKRADEEV